MRYARQTVKQRVIRLGLHLGVALQAQAVHLASFLPPRRLRPAAKFSVVLTGTFFSVNWIMNHLGPLSRSGRVRHVWLVTTFALPPVPGVTLVYPPAWMVRRLGEVGARLIMFVLVCLRRRPDLVGGFHLLINGLLAAVMARVVRGRSLYFCGGGPREVLDGGIHGSVLFGLAGRSDAVMERSLIRAVNQFDLVIAMGNRTSGFFRSRGVDRPQFAVIPGGIEKAAFEGPLLASRYDLILVGRLDGVKRIDIFLETVALLRCTRPQVRAAVVGAGELEGVLRAQASDLGVQECVEFAGYQPDVTLWLRQSRVFVMTSDSEGLSLALMEAMMCGLPAVVSDVGELGELVEHDVNGFLVGQRTPDQFALFIARILDDAELAARLGANARQASAQFEIDQTARTWDRVLGELT